MNRKILVDTQNLTKHFTLRSGLIDLRPQKLHAVERVNLRIYTGETLALVGESGCGKSTLGRLILRLTPPTEGAIKIAGQDVMSLRGEELQRFRRRVQIIFQDSGAALNPRKTVYQILRDPMLHHSMAESSEVSRQVSQLLEKVGLSPARSYLNRNPLEFSGGQRQRIGIARAMSVEPDLIVADEAVSALDVSIRGQILELMKAIQRERRISFLFITHDLAVVRSIAHRVAVMYLGQIVETAPVEEVFKEPLHPYTQALLKSTPIPNPREARMRERILLSGELPSPITPPNGCYFHTRCPFVMEICKQNKTEAISVSPDHSVACHLIK